jgi:multimeric flavodoxin WrbA
MKLMGICCSPRTGQATSVALNAALEAAREAVPGVQIELVDLSRLNVGPCVGCWHCREALECGQQDDFGDLIPRLAEPELGGLVVATPVYFATMSSQCKAFLDRCVALRLNGFLLRDKVGGVVTVGGARNGGQEIAIQAVHAAMLCQDMIIVGDGAPLCHFGGAVHAWDAESAARDETGLETARNLGKRVAELASRVHGG